MGLAPARRRGSGRALLTSVNPNEENGILGLKKTDSCEERWEFLVAVSRSAFLGSQIGDAARNGPTTKLHNANLTSLPL